MTPSTEHSCKESHFKVLYYNLLYRMLQIFTIEKNMLNSIWMMNPIQGSLLSTFIWHIVWNISPFCRYHNGSIRTSMHDSIWSIFFIILYVTYSTNYEMLSIKTAMFSIDLRCVHAWSQFNAIYLVWILIKSFYREKAWLTILWIEYACYGSLPSDTPSFLSFTFEIFFKSLIGKPWLTPIQ